jgi:regulation of enolase protein 1 (concanavalin A-like superfamily)
MRPRSISLPFLTTATLVLAAALPTFAAAPPSPWIARDIGTPAIPGSTEVDATGVWTIRGSGIELFSNPADNFQFAYQPIRGDATLTARFLSMEGGDPQNARVGLMVRDNDTPSSPKLTYAMMPGQLQGQIRFNADGSFASVGGVGPSYRQEPNLWLRLQRTGNEIAGFYSRGEDLWVQAFPPQLLPTLSLDREALLGLTVSSNQDSSLTTARFDGVSLQPGPVLVTQPLSSGSDGTVTLQWTPLPDAVGYDVYRGPAGASRAQLEKITPQPIAGPPFTDHSAGLVNGTSQTYAVAAVFPGAGGQPGEGPLLALSGTPVALPAGMTGCSINEGLLGGSAAFNPASGEFLVRGSGSDNWFNADQFYFMSQPVEGNVQITVRLLTTPPAELTTPSVPYVGIMIRESLDAGARNVAIGVNGNGLVSATRATTGGNTTYAFNIPPDQLQLPIVVRLTRTMSRIIAQYSLDDGKTFKFSSRVWFDTPLTSTMLVGVAVSGGSREHVQQATLNGLEIKRL